MNQHRLPLGILGVLILAGCGDRAPAAQPAAVVASPAPAPAQTQAQTRPAAVAATAPPVAPVVLAKPIDERFAKEDAGWRVSFHLSLPALPEASVRRVRRACEAWLFQGLIVPRASFAESAQEAHQLLITDNPHIGAADVWYAERAVLATHLGGGWLALSRSDSSFAGGAHPNSKLEGLVVQIDEVRALTLDEVVPPAQQPVLRRQLALGLRLARKLPAEGPLTSEVASDDDLPIPLPIIQADGARFVWNPYEIASYSEGVFEVVLSAAQMRPLLAANPW